MTTSRRRNRGWATISDSEFNYSNVSEAGDLDEPGGPAEPEDSEPTRARSTEGGTPLVAGEIPNPRPALTKLQADQEEILEELRFGFDTLGDVLQWCVKANVRTLGALEPEFYAARVGDRLALQWLTGEQRTNRDVDAQRAKGYREDLAITVEEACNWAYRFFRAQVTEYTDDQTPEVQMSGGSVAFRPALTELEQRQIATLLQARDGFGDRSELAKWERNMQASTFGEYVELPVYPLTRSPLSWEYGLMQTDVGKTTASRDIFLMDSVFPACVRGVRYLRKQADEDVDDGDSDNATLDA